MENQSKTENQASHERRASGCGCRAVSAEKPQARGCCCGDSCRCGDSCACASGCKC